MSAEPLSLDALLESVADGASIDWAAAEAAADDRQRRLLGHLRLVAGVAEVHRTIAAEDETGAPLMDIVTAGQAVPRWGHLLLLEKIGEGAFGEVYRARDPWLDREVALKLLRRGVEDRVPAARLVDEARTLARVRHPNVVTVYGADMHDGRVGLWMELVRGRTLAEIVASEGPFSAAEAAVIGQEICRALAAVHAAGLVHRDVKAQNVMREAGGRLVLMDFGAGQTPLYLGPELLDFWEATVAGDIYALGVLLYHLVTGRFPVTGTSLEELRKAHALGNRRRLGEARPDLPDAFVAAVERALHADPAQRYGSAREMQEALARVTSPSSSRFAAMPSASRAAPSKGAWLLAAAALVLLVGGLTYWIGNRTNGVAHAAVQTVAVLPLQGLSGDDQYLAASMTEAITQELAMAAPVKVASHTSVARLAARETPLRELASSLQADAIVEGTIFRAGQNIRVNVRVIHAGTNAAVWASSFERGSHDLPFLQRDLAQAIAAELRLALYPPTVARWRQGPTVGSEAYDSYLRGRYEARKYTQAGMQAALDHFRRAVALDPQFGRAHAAIAECFLRLGNDFGAIPLPVAAREARAAVARALERDDRLPDAHATLAMVKFEFDLDFGAAEEQYRRAIELDPSFVDAREAFALFLASRGRFAEAFEQIALARQLDPLSATLANSEGRLHYHARQYEDAVADLQRAAELDAEDVSVSVGLGRVYNAMGRHEDAIREYQRAAASFSGHPYFEAEIAQAEIPLGRIDSARKRISLLRSQYGQPASQVNEVMLALVYAQIDKEEAFRWLARAFDPPSVRVAAIKVDPRFDPLRDDPRFAEFLQRLQLEP